MAATGKTPILLYGSTTPTNAPVAGNLTNSSDGCEIAINVADKNLFFKDSTNVVNTVPIRQSSASSNGWLSSADWSTFNGKQPAGTYVTSVTGTAPVVSSGGTTPAISMAAATGSVNGYLTSTDWSTFNNKVSSQWVTSGSNIYYTAGNVGIATNSPSYNLDVSPAAGDGTMQLKGGGSYMFLNSTSVGYSLLRGQDNGTTRWGIGQIGFGGADGVALYTGSSNTQRVLVDSSGNTTISTGNLVIGTSGKGIDFSATAGTGTSELLADYEEGTWTPTVTTLGGAITTYTASGTYTKVGRQVTACAIITISNNGTGSGAVYATLPFGTPAIGYAGYGRESGVLFATMSIVTLASDNRMQITSYNNSYPGGTGSTIYATAVYFV